MPEDASSSQVFNYNTDLLIPTAHQRTSVLSFTEPSPRPSPSSSVDLCSICALVQIFYCILCISQNSFIDWAWLCTSQSLFSLAAAITVHWSWST